jgi:hypothetical protein
VILESIVTTLSPSGDVNVAPMGPWVNEPTVLTTRPEQSAERQQSAGRDPEFVLRPFEGSRTCDNLLQTRQATIHITDDVALFADAVLDQIQQPEQLVRELDQDGFRPLKRCHQWFAVQIQSITQEGPKYQMPCQVVASGVELPMFGLNRAKHAVIEAAILATRTHLISPETIRAQIQALTPLIEKTAGNSERAAFDRIKLEIDRRLDVQRELPNS